MHDETTVHTWVAHTACWHRKQCLHFSYWHRSACKADKQKSAISFIHFFLLAFQERCSFKTPSVLGAKITWFSVIAVQDRKHLMFMKWKICLSIILPTQKLLILKVQQQNKTLIHLILLFGGKNLSHTKSAKHLPSHSSTPPPIVLHFS